MKSESEKAIGGISSLWDSKVLAWDCFKHWWVFDLTLDCFILYHLQWTYIGSHNFGRSSGLSCACIYWWEEMARASEAPNRGCLMALILTKWSNLYMKMIDVLNLKNPTWTSLENAWCTCRHFWEFPTEIWPWGSSGCSSHRGNRWHQQFYHKIKLYTCWWRLCGWLKGSFCRFGTTS